MSYSPTTWQNGDTITAAKLNNMESGISAGENGWEVTANTLFSENITTAGSSPAPVANLAYTTLISAYPLTVTFEGTDYTPPVTEMGGSYAYGDVGGSGPDFTNYPFCIISTGAANMVYTENEGTYSISAGTSSVTTTANFSDAIKAAIDLSTLPLRCVEGVTTYDEATSAMNDGRLVYFTANDETYETTPKCFMVNAVGRPCTIVPTSTKIAAKFGTDDGLFYIDRL